MSSEKDLGSSPTVRFLIRRMDTLEYRLGGKIDKLEGFKNRVIGIAIAAGTLSGIIVHLVAKTLSS